METIKTGIMEKIHKNYIEHLNGYLLHTSVFKLYECLDDILPSWESINIGEKVFLRKDMEFLWSSIIHDPILEKISKIEDIDYDEVMNVQYDIINHYLLEEYTFFVKSLGFTPYGDDTYMGIEIRNFFIDEIFIIDKEKAWNRIETYQEEIALVLLEQPELAMDIEKLTEYLMEEGILSDEVDDFVEIKPAFLEKIKEVDAFLENAVLEIKEYIKEWAENNILPHYPEVEELASTFS